MFNSDTSGRVGSKSAGELRSFRSSILSLFLPPVGARPLIVRNFSNSDWVQRPWRSICQKEGKSARAPGIAREGAGGEAAELQYE